MKKWKLISAPKKLAATFFAVLLAVTACSSDSDPDPWEAFYGTWLFDGGVYHSTVIISNNKLLYYSNSGGSYTLEGLTWTPNTCADADYPTGYVISGTLTQYKDMMPPYKADRTTPADIGDTAYDCWHIHTNGASLVWLDWNSWDGTNYTVIFDDPFVK